MVKVVALPGGPHLQPLGPRWTLSKELLVMPSAVPTARVLRGVPLPVAGSRAHLPTLPLSRRGHPALLEGWGHLRTHPGVLGPPREMQEGQRP